MVLEAGYPPELTSPPVPLVALIGRPDLHLLLGDYLRTQNTPRLMAIGLPDPLQAPAKFGERGGAAVGLRRVVCAAGSCSRHSPTMTNRVAIQASVAKRRADQLSRYAFALLQASGGRPSLRAQGLPQASSRHVYRNCCSALFFLSSCSIACRVLMVSFEAHLSCALNAHNFGSACLQANWLAKHRSSRPAVSVLLVGRQLVAGDPASWARLVSHLEAVKGAG